MAGGPQLWFFGVLQLQSSQQYHDGWHGWQTGTRSCTQRLHLLIHIKMPGAKVTLPHAAVPALPCETKMDGTLAPAHAGVPLSSARRTCLGNNCACAPCPCCVVSEPTYKRLGLSSCAMPTCLLYQLVKRVFNIWASKDQSR